MSTKLLLLARFVTLGLAVAFIPYSVSLCHLSLLLYCIVCLLEGGLRQKLKEFFANRLAWLLPAFFLLHVAGVFYSGNVSNAWANIDKKIAFLIIPLFIASADRFSRQELQQLMLIFVASCFGATLICFANATLVASSGAPLWSFGPAQPYVALHPGASDAWTHFTYNGLASGIHIHPTYFSFYLLTCVLMLTWYLSSHDTLTSLQKYLLAGVILYFVMCVSLLSSRIVVVTTLLSMITIFIAVRPRFTVLAPAGVALLVAMLIVNPVARYRNLEEYKSTNFVWPPPTMSDNPISIRTSLWWTSLHALKISNPIIGNGTGDVNDTMRAVSDDYNVHNVLDTSDPHNQYVHTYLALGFIGLLALLAVLMVPLVLFASQRKLLVCLWILSLMIVCLTESALELQKGIVLFSLFTGLTGNQVRTSTFSSFNLLTTHKYDIHETHRRDR